MGSPAFEYGNGNGPYYMKGEEERCENRVHT